MRSLSLVMSECSLSGRGHGHVSNFYLVDLENFATASRRYTGNIHNSPVSPAAKSKNISLCGEIMKLGTLIEDSFRLGPNSETPPGGRHLEFYYGRHTFAYNFETKADKM